MFLTRQRFVALAVLTVFAVSTAATRADNPRITPLVKAVEHCRNFVVNIHTEKNASGDGESRFFNQKSRRVSGMGTGIVVDERGYIVTNYHVIHEVDKITVTLANGETVSARPVSFDRKHDMAIILVNASAPLTVMPMGTSSDVRLAEQVFAVGNAFGYEYTVTAGIVSALGRDVEVDETQAYENLIQTDASINPGNSGGPLLNVMGEVIGINVAIRAGAQRIGFAIPMDDARKTISRLLSTERLNGVSHGLFSDDVKSPTVRKLIVREVTPGSAAAKCGLQAGDRVNNVRGVTIYDGADWERSLLDIPIGKVLDVQVERAGEPLTLQLTVGLGQRTAGRPAIPPSGLPVRTVSKSTNTVVPPAPESIRDKARRLYGFHLAPLTARDRGVLGRQFNGGMKIVSVDAGSLAQRHGILTGDILLGLDGFETLGDRNLNFILQDSRLRNLSVMKFQIFRKESLVGQMVLKKSR